MAVPSTGPESRPPAFCWPRLLRILPLSVSACQRTLFLSAHRGCSSKAGAKVSTFRHNAMDARDFFFGEKRRRRCAIDINQAHGTNIIYALKPKGGGRWLPREATRKWAYKIASLQIATAFITPKRLFILQILYQSFCTCYLPAIINNS